MEEGGRRPDEGLPLFPLCIRRPPHYSAPHMANLGSIHTCRFEVVRISTAQKTKVYL
jgi:hypothetical protein